MSPSQREKRSRRKFLALVALLGAALLPAKARTQVQEVARRPIINKIEPPNWWAGLTPQLMLLISGRRLQNAAISCTDPAVDVIRFRAAAAGDYLFVWLRIGAEAKPGTVACQVETPTGKTALNFRLSVLPSAQGKFQGLNDDDVLYLIMVDRFADGNLSNDQVAAMPGTFDRSNPRAYHGGDLQGIEDHLDYLQQLGITALWLTPIVANDPRSPQDYHGYGAVDEYAVNPHFGTLADLQRLVAAAHQRGMKVILDFVANHVGPRNPWAVDPPESDWFHGTVQHHTAAASDFQFLADPHAPPSLWRNVVDGWFANVLPDLNQENPEVRRYLIQNAIWWAEETGIDGYRLDTFPYVSRGFWSQFHQALHHLFPNFFTVGEVFNPDPDVTSFFAGGRKQYDGIDTGVTSVFDFPFYFALRGVTLNHASPKRLVDVLSHDRLYAYPQLLVPFLGNHDVVRFTSAPNSSTQKLELAFSVLLTMRGVPQVYYGDEIGMSGGADPDNRHDFPGGFPGDWRDAFHVAGRTRQEQEIFRCVQKLLELRRANAALSRGKLWNIGWDRSSYAYARILSDERLLIAFNASAAPHALRLSFCDTPLAGARFLEPVFEGAPKTVNRDSVVISLPAEGFGIWKAR